jgi:putative transposase
MATRGHNEEAILRVLREAESGETVVEVCRKHGISQQTFYLWKKKYSFDPLLLSFRRTQSGGIVKATWFSLKDSCLSHVSCHRLRLGLDVQGHPAFTGFVQSIAISSLTTS